MKDRSGWKQMFISVLGGNCVNCFTVSNLQFDHVIPEDKKFDITTRIPTYRLKTLLVELQKCQLLCGPCHYAKSTLDRGYHISSHGMPGHYTNHKCRCEDCRQAWNHYVKTRRKASVSL